MSGVAESRWDRYWYRPGPVFDLAVCRVLCVGSQLFFLLFPYALMTFTPFRDFAGDTAYTDEEYHPPLLLQALTLGIRPSYEFLVGVLCVSTLAAAGALVGLFTRLCCLVLALGSSILIAHDYSYYEKHHVEAMTVLMLYFLAFSPSGRALSLDALWRDRRRAGEGRIHRWVHERDRAARWPLILLRWHFAICYFSAAYCKLGGGGGEWLNGFTLQYYLLQDGIYWNLPLGIWAGQQHTLALVAGWLAIILEGLFFLVLIFPRTAWFFVPGVIGLHLGIYFTMGAPFLQYVPLYAVFVPWTRVLRALFPQEAGAATPARA